MHSMTGFGRGSASTELCSATIEIAGVNRKQAEVVVQGIRDQVELENRIRKQVLGSISRGRLQVAVVIKPAERSGSGVEIDLEMASKLENAFVVISEHLDRVIRPETADFMKIPGLVRFDDPLLEPESTWEAVGPALEMAIVQLLEMRKAEGSDLAADLVRRVGTLEELKNRIATQAANRPGNFRDALWKRLADAQLEIDLNDERVVREIALFADRSDISEEVTRLDSHLSRFREYLAGSEPAGRPLDFLCQEIHREFNTIGSKASDAAVAQDVVSAKTELEKIREQVQNIE